MSASGFDLGVDESAEPDIIWLDGSIETGFAVKADMGLSLMPPSSSEDILLVPLFLDE